MNWPVTKRAEACVRNANAKHAWIVWLDRSAIFKVKSLCRREMPHHFNCCVPGCTNSFRSKPHLQYYRIPRTEKLRKTHQVLLRNETLKLHSNQTRACSERFEGGQKLSRQHLPSLFPWTKRAEQRRQIIKHKREPKRKKKKQESNLSVPAILKDHSVGTMQDDMKVDQRNIVTKKSSLSVDEENLATIESDVTVDPRYNATEKSETNADQLFVTTDSQTDLNLMSVEEITKELNCLRK